MIKVDYDKASGGLIDPGTYEVVIGNVGFRQTKGGNEYFSVPLIVRNDVEQKFQNAIIWDAIYTSSDKSIAYKVSNIGKAVGMSNGQEFDSLESWGNCVSGKPMRVKIDHEEYNGYTNARVKEYTNTNNKEFSHKYKDQKSIPDGFYPINETLNDEDCPF